MHTGSETGLQSVIAAAGELMRKVDPYGCPAYMHASQAGP